MLTIIYAALGILVLYFLVSLGLTYLVQQIRRNPVIDKPDWGKIRDTRIPAKDSGFLEVWQVRNLLAGHPACGNRNSLPHLLANERAWVRIESGSLRR